MANLKTTLNSKEGRMDTCLRFIIFELVVLKSKFFINAIRSSFPRLAFGQYLYRISFLTILALLMVAISSQQALAVAPTVMNVTVTSGTTVDVTFNQAMDGVTVLVAANYSVSGTGQGSLANNPDNVVLQAGNTYRLTWIAGEMVNLGDITITVAAVVENAIFEAMGVPDSGTDVGGAIGTAPTVTGVSVVNSTTVDVTFSEPMGAGVVTAANYTISGTGQGSLANNPNIVALQAGTTYRLTWAAGSMQQGGTVTITVNNVSDVAGNAIGAPNSGSVSQVLIPTLNEWGMIIFSILLAAVSICYIKKRGSGLATG
jgi:uncharacterized cupredoxin-like copper-binding protein